MSYRRALPLSVLLSTCILAQPSLAQETYLLQLGSFETQQEAQGRWDVLQRKYPELLSGLSLRVMDVTLPPDNFTVYRTQAGPLASNANAVTICDRLTTRGDECYVIETAMYAPNAEPGSVPNPPLMMADDSTIRQAVTPSAQPVEENPEPAQEVAQEVPADLAPLEEPSALLEDERLPEPETMAESTTPVATPAPLEVAQPDVPQPEPEEQGSFWSFLDGLNPFSSDEDEEPEVAAAENETDDTNLAVPVEPIDAEPLAQSPAPLLDAMPPSEYALADTQPIPVPQEPAQPAVSWEGTGLKPLPGEALQSQPQPQPQPQLQPQPYDLSPAAGALPMPPQPPEDETFRMASDEKLTMARQTGTIAVPMHPANPPFAIKPNAAGASAAPGMVPPPPPVMGTESGDVTVAEAVPVPLSGDTIPVPSYGQPALNDAPIPAAAMPGRQSARSHSLWAQLGYFVNEQAAFGYWEAYRAQHPELPPLRARAVSPYNIQSTQPRVSLRVGPFEQSYQITAMCEQLQTPDIHCRPAAELEASDSHHGRGGALPSRYAGRERGKPGPALSMYWVQLGSFASQGAAEGAWQSLNEKYQDIMADFKSDIASPAMSSGEAMYRLRSGPFPLRHKADALCNTLKMRGDSCLVVFGQ